MTTTIRAVAVRDGQELVFVGPGGRFAVRPVWFDEGVESYPLLAPRPGLVAGEPTEWGVYEVDAEGLQMWTRDYPTLETALVMASIYALDDAVSAAEVAR